MIRKAYEQVAALFVEAVNQVDSALWNTNALGDWTVRELVGHTNRAVLTVETDLNNPSESDATINLRRNLSRPGTAVGPWGETMPGTTPMVEVSHAQLGHVELR